MALKLLEKHTDHGKNDGKLACEWNVWDFENANFCPFCGSKLKK